MTLVVSGEAAEPHPDQDQLYLLSQALAWWEARLPGLFSSGEGSPDGYVVYVHTAAGGTIPSHPPFFQTSSDCAITRADLYLPPSKAPNALALYIHLLGDALGLDHDAYYLGASTCSVMDAACATDARVASFVTDLLVADMDLLIAACVQ